MRLLLSLALALGLATPALATIDIQPVTSPQGRSAWLVEEHSIPFVSIEVIFAGGASVDPADRAGAVALMTALLNEGAGDLDSQGYAAALESLAGSVSFDSGRDQVSMTIRALTENRDQVVDLAILALTEARFDDQSIDRVRAQMVASLERSARDPNTIAQQVYAELGYDGHAYARASDGTPDSEDAFPNDPFETLDTDNDGIGNNADPDDDNLLCGQDIHALLVLPVEIDHIRGQERLFTIVAALGAVVGEPDVQPVGRIGR